MRVTVTTCGTSILAKRVNSDEERKFLIGSANKRKEEYTPDELKQLHDIRDRTLDLLLKSDEAQARAFSAELNGFIGLYQRDGTLANAKSKNNGKADMHFLFCTDTYQGQLVGEILEKWGKEHDIILNVVSIDDLNTASVEEFRLGINKLVEECASILPTYRAQGYEVIFNLVGGFKALQGYMQTLGMFYADETIYIFEASQELLSIPRLPVDFAAQAKQAVLDHFDVFRRMACEDVPCSECAGIPETLLSIMDGKCALSAWGSVIWGECQRDAYSQQILPTASPRIIVSDKVQKQSEDLEPDRIIAMNQALDKLSRFVETNGKENLHSCDFRKLEGDPLPPSTHEFNLWPDMGGWRGFCHWEGKKLIVDQIGLGIGHKST